MKIAEKVLIIIVMIVSGPWKVDIILNIWLKAYYSLVGLAICLLFIKRFYSLLPLVLNIKVKA